MSSLVAVDGEPSVLLTPMFLSQVDGGIKAAAEPQIMAVASQSESTCLPTANEQDRVLSSETLVADARGPPSVNKVAASAAMDGGGFVSRKSSAASTGVFAHAQRFAGVDVQPSLVEVPLSFDRLGFPTSYDLRSLGAVTSIKDQGSCGSCWAFATYGSLESTILVDGGTVSDLSENHLKNYHGFDYGPCEGGNSFISQAYLSRGDGPVREVDDPYHDYDDRPSPGGPPQYYAREMLMFDTDDELKYGLITYGAIATSMHMNTAYFDPESNTYYYNGTTCPNHGVTIVGWDDTVAVPSAPGPGGWLVKNSGGTAWGDEGYFWISYYDTRGANDGFCFHDVVSPETYQTIYYHDRFGYIDSLNRSFAFNAFKATSEQDLVAVGFWTLTDGASYDVRVYSTFSGGSLSGLLAAETGICTFAGAHTIDLAMPLHLTEGQDFYIYVQLMDAGTYPMAFDIRLSGYNSASSASPGQSYYSADGANWTDLTTFHPTANFCIKGLAAIPSPPEVTVLGNGISISDGSAVPRTEDHTQFGVAVLGGSPVSRTFVVVNEGTQTLSLGSVYVPAGFTLTEGVVTNLTAGDSDTFTVQLDTGTIGSKNGDISFSTNDSDENPFNFRIAGTVVSVSPPEVSVLGNGIIINDGDTTPSAADHTDFGNTFLGSPGISRTFTVRNEGGSPLTLGTVTVPTGFTLAEPLVSSLAVGASDTFTVRLDAVLVGSKSGDVAFVTNDPDENPFSFQISGVVEALPSDRTVGNTTVFSEVTLVPNRRAVPYTMSEAGQLESISIYHDGGSGRVLLAVYADGAGKPGARLGVTDSTVIHATEGWQTVDLPSPVSVSGGQTIWLAWVFENNPGIRFTAGTPGRADSTATWSDGMPTTFGTCAVASYVYSIYATYSPSTGTSTVGNTTVFSGVALVANRRAVPYTMTEAGQLESITIYHDGGTGHLILAVYGDSTGKPGTRLGVTSSTVIHATEGWQTVNLQSPISVASGQTIWLAWVFENNPGIRFTAGTPGRADSPATWSGGMPTTFGTSTVAGYIYSIYATYSPSTGTSTVGNTTVFSEVTTAATRRAAPYTMTEAGQLESISIYHEGGSGHVILAVYADSASKPGARLGITNPSVIHTTEGWQTVSLQSPVSVASAQTIWLAWVFENNPGIRFTAGTAGRADSSATWSGGMPTMFGACTIDGYIYSLYATYDTVLDTTPPADVSSFAATAGDEQISLSWTNPTDADFAGVKILRKTGSHPTTPTDGDVVYDGTGMSTTDTGLTNGTTYYYTAFSYDAVPNYSAGATTSGTPEASTTSTVGNTTVFSGVALVANRRAVPYTMTEAGQLESITIYHDGGTGHLILAVYGDSTGKPGTRLGVTSSTVIHATEGWQTVNLQSPISVASGQTIWLAWLFENNPGVRFTAGTPGRADSSATWSGGMPSTFGASTVASYIYSIYATYNPSTGTNTVGNTTVFSEVTTAPTRRAAPYTMTEAGQLESISIYHEGGSGHLILAVYGDSAGKPGTRLGITNSTVINATESWQTVNLQSPLFVASGQIVWLAWVFENNPGIRFTAGTPGRADSSATWSGGMPTTFGTSTVAGYIYSVYATYSTGPDTTPPADVSGFTAMAGDEQISLSWTNPTDADFAGVKILRKTGSHPTTPTDGTVVYDGTGTSTTDTGLTNGTTYYYTAFSYDGVPNYSAGATTSGTPEASTTSTIGNTTVFSEVTLVANRRAVPYTMSKAGQLESMSIYHDGGSGRVLLAVYADSVGKPGARLGITNSTVINAIEGWQTVNLQSLVSVASGQTIWLAWVFENNPGVRFTAGTPGRADSTATWSGGMPSTFGTSTVAGYIYSIYATYSPSTGTSTVGNTTVFSEVTTAATRRAAPYTMTEAGQLESISIYHVGGSGHVILALYADSAGKPGARLGITNPSVIHTTEGWQTVGLQSPVFVASGQAIWLAWVFEDNPGIRFTAGTPGRADSSATWLGGMPTMFGACTIDGYIYSVYATYAAGTSGNSEVTVFGNGVSVADGDSTPSVVDGTDFGNTMQGDSGIARTFTVRNDGGSTLILGPVTVPTGFTLTEGLASSLDPGASDSFAVRLDTATAGTRSGDISFSTNDADENPFNFRILGVVMATAAPEVTVLGNGLPISDEDATPSAGDYTDFGSVAQGSLGVSHHFTVRNDGTATLTLGAVIVPPGFTLIEGLVSSLAPGTSDTFTVRLNAAVLGTKTGDISFPNNDSDESPFNFQITGAVIELVAPEIAVFGNGMEIEDGDTTPGMGNYEDFGFVIQQDSPVSHLFVVRNNGTAVLTLGPVSVPTGFTLTDGLPSSLGPGESDAFTVRLDTAVLGTKTGDVSFANNDSDENPFNFRIIGRVVGPAPEITVLGNDVEIGDGDTTPSVADHTDFGSVLLGSLPVNHIFTVRNDGGSSLTLGPVTVPVGFTVSGLSDNVEPGEWDEFTVQLDTAVLGTKGGYVSFATNDSDENPFNFWITGDVTAVLEPEITVLGNDVEIMDGDTTPFVADHTDFGSVAQGGSPISRTFTVHNEGVAILTLGDVVVPPGFTLTEGLPVSLAPGESDTFTVRLDTATPGTRTRDVTFTTNDEDEGLFNFRIVGMVRDPHTEITVLGNGIPISDGDATPSTVDGTDFGRVLRGELFMGQPWIRQTFTVRNDGTSTLTLASVTAPSGFEVVERPRLALAPGSSDTFTVQMYTSFYVDGWYGIRGGDISFVTNDSDESPFNFQIRGEVGEPVGPEITVDGIWNGDTTPSPYNYTDLGPAAKGGAPAASVFKVRNDGIATLTLGPVTVPTGFTLAEGLSTSLEPGREDMFTVRLDTGIVGTKRGVVSFTTNDPDASVFSFQIAGEVVDRVVPQFASYAENFEGEFLWMIRPTVVEGWQYYSSAAHGRIEVGYGRLRMDCAVDSGTYCLNEAILHLDLTDHSNVHMTLDHWNISDENTSLPSTFTGHCNGDGIALSVDGVHWVKVMDLAGDFTAHSFLLDTFVEQAKTYAGSPDVSDVRIKFQQYGNSTRFSDGRDFDNIATTQPVYFADPGLKTAVEQQLGISDPCALDMLDLWELDAGGMGISDLTGLECAKNLHRLHAPVNQIDDLSPLAGLPLGSLCLDNNGISDITTLSALPTLGELYLNENQISDITAIAGLVNLGRLELNDNQISDLSPIASLTKLDRLEMSRNAVVDISPLSSLRNLMTLEMTDNQINDISGLGGVDRFGHLFLSRNQISDISPLWGADLGWLRIDSNHISDMTPICWAESLYNVWLNDNQITHVPSLSELISLEVLDLLNNQIDDLTGFEDSGLPELWYIRLNENRIADLRPLSSLSGLPELQLELSMNQISDLRPLSNLSSLSALTLEGNQIADIGPLSGLVALEGLGLSGNQLTDIGAVVSLINLRILNLQFNQISELRPVSGLINLRALTFGHNQVEDISPLGGLMNLQWLSTYENRISDISVLSGLANLSVLYAYSNQISDISPLSDLANLAVVDLHENHISDISLLVELRALISLDLRQNPLNSDAYDIYLPLIAANNPGMSLEYDAEQIVYFADANLRTAVEEALGISDPTPAEILGLTSLSAETRGILSVIGLEYAVNLRSLDLSDNEISDISPLSELTNLTYLDLRRNPLNANAHNIHIPQIEANNPGITLLYDLAEPVYFADANLKAAVEEALGVSDPLPSDMLTLVNVNFDGREIADLTGIEYAENLTGLWLNNNEITDIGALAGLVRLYTLMLNHNQISDLSAVSGMTDLMYLEVMENQVVDIGPLAGLSNLEVLRLDGNLIEEVGPLSTCANLSLLWLDDNEIVSLNALVGLTNLRHLHVNRNSISDLTPIAGLVNLIDLELSDNQVSDLSPISGLRPYTLFLDKNQISDLSPLAGLLGIHTLSLQSNQIGDLNPLSGLVSLWSLCLDDNQIGDLNPLSGLVNLGALHLAENQIADLSPLSGITGLGELDLADNQIVDLTCLSALTGLGTVNLARNQISDISALSGLTELEYLDLRENPLNEDAYSIYIPQILANNPGMNMEYDPQ